MERKYLRAGEFAAAARLTPKALRLYAEQGLLVPAVVDPATGYRSYLPDQLPRARLIARLRRLGLPLVRIAVLADLTPQARAIELRGWLRSQRTRLDERVAAMEAVQNDAARDAFVAAVRLRSAPAVKVLCRARHVDTTALEEHIDSAERDIREHLRASKVPDTGQKLVTFTELVTPDNTGLVEVAVGYEGTVEPVADLFIRLMPARTEAYLPVPARDEDYPLILRVYDAIEAWTDAHPDVTCTGHPYETYPGTDARFDVAYPVTR